MNCMPYWNIECLEGVFAVIENTALSDHPSRLGAKLHRICDILMDVSY